MYFYLNGVVANALIHSFMYYSYYKTSIGQPPSWKIYLTKAQIVQFVWGITSFLPFPLACGYEYTSVSGPMFVFWFNQAVLLSFFFLFMSFFTKKYSSPNAEPRKPPRRTQKSRKED